MKGLLATLSLGVFAGALDLSVLSPALPALGHQFDVATNDLAWIFTLYLLVTVLSIAIASTLADRYGRRPVYLACIGLFALGSIIAILAPNYGIFLVARAIQALGAGGIFPVATATIGDVVPQERRGAALGMVAGMWGLAAVIGPAFGGLVTHYISWRWIFVANIPLAIAVFVMARKNVPKTAPHTRDPLDVLGLILLCTGLLGVMDGLLAQHLAIGILGVLFLAAFFFGNDSRDSRSYRSRCSRRRSLPRPTGSKSSSACSKARSSLSRRSWLQRKACRTPLPAWLRHSADSCSSRSFRRRDGRLTGLEVATSCSRGRS